MTGLGATRLFDALAEDRVAVGTCIHFSDPAVVEIAGVVGFDWVSIILEHAPLSVADVEAQQRAADLHGLTTLVHLAGPEDPRILPLLDSGVGGIVSPHVSERSQAEALVEACRFPPLGDRGVHTSVRALDYGGADFGEYFANADARLAVGVAIEDVTGVENADEILGVPGIDIALCGLLDLSQSLGVPGEFRHPEVQAAVRSVAAAAGRHGVTMSLSHYAYTVEEILDLGARMIFSPGTDYSFLREGFRAHLAGVRDAAATARGV